MGFGVRRRGATKVEYALLLLLISLGSLLVVTTVGSNVADLFNGVIPPGEARPASEDSGAAPGQPDDPDTGRGKKPKKARPNRGQPGLGNPGNDKAAGNGATAPAPSR